MKIFNKGRGMVKKKKEKEIRFPRNLYKQGGSLKLYSGGEKFEYSTVLVKDKDEYDKNLKKGYYDDFGVVILGTEEETIEAKDIESDDDF